MSIIRLSNVSKAYQLGKHEHFVLQDINLTINAGELLSIMGASGSGKSTLMNIIGLLDRPSSGDYFFEEREISSLDENELARLRNHMLGFVFQSFFLLPRLTALQNVALPLQYARRHVEHAKEYCMEMLEKVGMGQYAKQKPNQLSGGQQQRVAIARALILNPQVILADEPTGALDSRIGQEVMDLFLRLNQKDKTTIVIITHDEKIAKQCQRIMYVHDGKMINQDDLLTNETDI